MRTSILISLEVVFITLSALGLLGLRQATARTASRVSALETQASQLQRQLDACYVKTAQAHQSESLLQRARTPLAPPDPRRTVWLRDAISTPIEPSSTPLRLASRQKGPHVGPALGSQTPDPYIRGAFTNELSARCAKAPLI